MVSTVTPQVINFECITIFDILNNNKEIIKSLVEKFIESQVEELQEEGYLALEMAEEENDYHICSYWISGTYDAVGEFITTNYKKYGKELCTEIMNRYTSVGDLTKLDSKIKTNFKTGSYDAYMAYECLASLLLKEFQKSDIWCSVYGCQEEDLFDFGKYHILNALNDKDEFPVMKMEDVTAAMLGINTYVQPSDMYDVFAHYADSLSDSTDTLKESIFTPDPFEYEAVNSRWKNYVDIQSNIKKGKNSDIIDYMDKLSEIEKAAAVIKLIDNAYYEIARAIGIKDLVRDKYYNQFNKPPYSFPLHENNLILTVEPNENKLPTIRSIFKIRGIQNSKTIWKEIYNRVYEIPADAFEVQQMVLTLAIEIKKTLVGMEKERNSIKEAIVGLYPRKELATHGLKLIDNLSSQKDNAKARFSLSMAEKQSLYIIKKSLRYAVNPVISCSFGNDSTLVLWLVRKVKKHGFNILFNNSYTEYSETIKFRDRLIKEWDIGQQLIETFPAKGDSFWDLVDRNGWNFQRKGDRREGENGKKVSNSELCCKSLKHVPSYNAIAKYKWDMNFSGVRGDESLERAKAGKRDGQVYYAKTWSLIRVNPILHWTNSMAMDYVKENNVPINEIYSKVLYDDDGKVVYSPRCGCQYCALTVKYGYLRWMREFKPKEYDFMMNTKGMAKVLYAMGMGYSTQNTNSSNNKTQLSLFDDNYNFNKDLSDEKTQETLNNMSYEHMEYLIQKRPCIFQNV